MKTTAPRVLRNYRALLRALAILALALSCPVHAAETVTYFHNDVLGSPTIATDSNGLITWRETYRPYGDRLVQSSTAGNNKLWFAGKSHDPGSGLNYLGARYYDPSIGRFMAMDPAPVDLSNLHSFNRFAYANNNPNKYVDPDGGVAAAVIPIVVVGIPVAGCALMESCYGGLKQFLSMSWDGAKGIANLIGNALPRESDDEGESSDSTLKPGEHAGESIPARSPDRDFTPEERDRINEIGRQTGCHTCGSTEPGTASGNFVPDHQPPTAVNPEGGEQRLYPHCLRCSNRQGGEARQAKQRQQQQEKPQPPQDTPVEEKAQ